MYHKQENKKTKRKARPEVKKLLLIEDNEADIKMVMSLLERAVDASFITDTANRLSDAIDSLSENSYDLILLDLGLPDSNQLDTFTQVHKNAGQVPVVVLSSNDDTCIAKMAVHQGAQDYLVKENLVTDLLERSITYSIERNQINAKLKKNNERMDQAKQAAEYTNKAKNELIAKVHREIRCVLNSVSGGATLMRTLELESAHIKCLTFIDDGTETLYRLMEKLNITQIDVGNTQYEFMTFNTRQTINQTIRSLKEIALKNHVSIKTTYDKTIPEYIHSAPLSMQQILTTLIRNSINHAKFGELEINITPLTENEIQIEVIEAGKWVHLDYKNHLERTPLNPRRETQNDTEDLGLATCQKICTDLEWKISVKAKSNNNSRFCLTIAHEPAKARQEKSTKSDPNEYINMGSQYPLKVLVADDSENTQRVAKALLNMLGYHPHFVSDGLEAVSAFAHNRYDLVLMDIQMPEMDGLSAAHILKEQFEDEFICIAAFTTFAQETDKISCLEAGLDAHLSKPLKLEELVPLLKKTFEAKVEAAAAAN